MEKKTVQSLDFERRAREDWMVWLFLVAGIAIFTLIFWDRSHGLIEGEESFVVFAHIVMAMGAACLLWIAVTALLCDASRGCKVDSEAGVFEWWLFKGSGKLQQGGRIELADIRRIEIQSESSEDEKVVVFLRSSEEGVKVELTALPHSHRAWVSTLCQRYPHIETNIEA